jgi:hypothetical protein
LRDVSMLSLDGAAALQSVVAGEDPPLAVHATGPGCRHIQVTMRVYQMRRDTSFAARLRVEPEPCNLLASPSGWRGRHRGGATRPGRAGERSRLNPAAAARADKQPWRSRYGAAAMVEPFNGRTCICMLQKLQNSVYGHLHWHWQLCECCEAQLFFSGTALRNHVSCA